MLSRGRSFLSYDKLSFYLKLQNISHFEIAKMLWAIRSFLNAHFVVNFRADTSMIAEPPIFKALLKPTSHTLLMGFALFSVYENVNYPYPL